MGLEHDERREIAPDGHFAASPGLSRPYPTRLAFGTGAMVARMVTLYQAVDMGVAQNKGRLHVAIFISSYELTSIITASTGNLDGVACA